MKKLLVILLLSCILLLIASNQSLEGRHHHSKPMGEELVLSGSSSDNVPTGQVDHHVVTEQERLDTIVRAFHKLPPQELELIGVDLSTPVLEGTERARLLSEAWVRRQRDFKAAIETLVKPAEYMASLSSVLRNTSHLEEQILVDTLKELEFLLADIDNSRDFHTIGGWPILVGMLDNRYTSETRAMAAWAIGTAVKNSYDYQLWTLERFHNGAVAAVEVGAQGNATSIAESTPVKLTSSVIDHFLGIVWDSASHYHQIDQCPVTGVALNIDDDDHMLRRTLYALFTATRGNPDVQEAVMSATLTINTDSKQQLTTSKFEQSLETLVTTRASCIVDSLDVQRKVWSFVSDVMSEWEYAKGTLLQSQDLTPEMKKALEELPMIGELFCNARWGHNVVNSVDLLIQRYSLNALQHLFQDSIDVVDNGDSLFTINNHDANILRAILDSLNLVSSYQQSQCHLDVNQLHQSDEISLLLDYIRRSTLAETVHKAAFEDMNSTLTYSDSQY